VTDRIKGPGAAQLPPVQRRRARPAQPGFDQALDRLVRDSRPAIAPSGELEFSRHALARLESRGVEFDASERERLTQAVDALSERGARESLVLTDNAAYVVGVPKRTVITAMPRSAAMGTIFTNIDSTYVL